MQKLSILIAVFVANLLLINNVKAYDIYKIGEKVQVAGENYYVIADSNSKLDYVTLLKEEPLLYSEIKPLISSTEIATQIEKDNQNNTSYLKMSYLYSETCSTPGVDDGCFTDYNLSSIKQVVDVWAKDKFKNNELKEVDKYSARLITLEELRDNLGYKGEIKATEYTMDPTSTPNWVYNSKYSYGTMSTWLDDTTYYKWYVDQGGNLRHHMILWQVLSVRPVINSMKNAIVVKDKNDDKIMDDYQDKREETDKDNKNNSTVVQVANTLLHKHIIPIIIGLVIIGLGLTIYIVILRKKK